MFFTVFRSRSLQNRPGTCLNASGMCFASNLHMETGKIIRKSIRSEHFGILQFWEFFCQPFGENTLSKNGPKTNIEKLKKPQSFLSNQITARHWHPKHPSLRHTPLQAPLQFRIVLGLVYVCTLR